MIDQTSTNDDEPVVLSRYSGGFIPDPMAPKKIESFDWPAPIAFQAVTQLMRTQRHYHNERHSNSNEIICEEDQISIDEQIGHDDRLDKDIDHMIKLKDSSGMAHALLDDLRLQEKILARQVPLDPWKASRSASAAIEPTQRCRFDSPKFASPSRRVHTHSSSTANNPDESLATLSSMSHTGKSNCLPQYAQHGERVLIG
jgi:hypothetical protein